MKQVRKLLSCLMRNIASGVNILTTDSKLEKRRLLWSTYIELTGFGKVTCSNINQKRVIINPQDQPDPITTIFTGSAEAGSKSFRGKYVLR